MATTYNLDVLSRAFAIADRVATMRRQRADADGIRSGLGIYRNVWGNAMLDFANGRPWRGVDYGALRSALRTDAMPSPQNVVDRLYRRMLSGKGGN